MSAHRAKHRKRRARYRQPSKLTVAAAGVSAVGTIAVASGVAFAATNGPASQAAPSRSAAGTVASQAGSLTDAAHQLTGQRTQVRALELDRLAVARREAARRAARRRAAARARRLAAEQAAQQAAEAQQRAQQRAQQAAQQAAQQSAASAASPSGSPQQIAMGMLGSYGWSASQFGCLDSLWNAESGWNVTATNPTSGAYGIPQALPGSKMASAGADWQTDAATQISWGLGYIKSLYGTPCGAWAHEEADGWY